MQQNEPVRTLDLTPTWSGLLPMMLDIIRQNGSPESVKLITQEFRNMARIADLYVAEHKNER